MGRGRAKAKQTKVARDLKYRSHETDFGALAQRAAWRRDDQAEHVERRAPDDSDEWADYSDSGPLATDASAAPRLGPLADRLGR